MSLDEELLNTMSEMAIEHTYTVADSDSYFVVDPSTRTMENASSTMNVLMQGDHRSEVYTFQIPKTIDGHNMLLCNRVRVHFNNIGDDGSENEDVAELYDLRLNPDDTETVIVSWEITRQATRKVGILSFLVQYECVEDGESVYEWHTDIYSKVEVKRTINNAEAAVIEYSNILEQWYQRIFGTGEGVIESIQTEGSTQISALREESQKQQDEIEAKGQEALKTIPDEYTKVYQMAEEALRTKSDAIAIDVEGESISIKDASDDYLLGLRVFGKTAQTAVPTPDSPQELMSINDANIMVLGKNIIPETSIEFTRDLYMSLGFKYPADRYSFSAVITSTDTDADTCAIMFYVGEEWVDSVFIPRSVNGERVSYTKTIVGDFDTVRFYAGRSYNLSEGDTCVIVDMQLERANTVTDFEPYSVYTINMSRSLPGIPVTSGGNYTDANGQQWISDEVDFEHGVYVQRVEDLTLSGNLNWYYNTDTAGKEFFYTSDNSNVNAKAWETRLLCSHTPAIGGRVAMDSDYWTQFSGTGAIRIRYKGLTSLNEFKSWLSENVVKIYYVLATPIETELTTTELNTYKALRTNKPNTVIQNDSGAYMKVTYAADTLTFLRDNQPRPTDEQVESAVNVYLDQNGVQVPSDDHINSLIDSAIGGIVNGEY